MKEILWLTEFFWVKNIKKMTLEIDIFPPKMSVSRYIIICAVKHRNMKSKDLSPVSMTLGMYLKSRI